MGYHLPQDLLKEMNDNDAAFALLAAQWSSGPGRGAAPPILLAPGPHALPRTRPRTLMRHRKSLCPRPQSPPSPPPHPWHKLPDILCATGVVTSPEKQLQTTRMSLTAMCSFFEGVICTSFLPSSIRLTSSPSERETKAA